MTDATGWIIDVAQNKLVLLDNDKKIVVVGIDEIDDFLFKYTNKFRINLGKTAAAAKYISAWEAANPLKVLKINAQIGFRNYAATNTKVNTNDLSLYVDQNELVLYDRNRNPIVVGIDAIDQFMAKYTDKITWDLRTTAAGEKYQDDWNLAHPDRHQKVNDFLRAREAAQLAAAAQKSAVDTSTGTVQHTDTLTGTTSTANTTTGTVAVTTPTGQTVVGTGSVTAGGVTTTVNPVTNVVTTQNPATGVTIQTNAATGQTVTTAQVAATNIDAGKLALIGLVGLLLLRGAIR